MYPTAFRFETRITYHPCGGEPRVIVSGAPVRAGGLRAWVIACRNLTQPTIATKVRSAESELAVPKGSPMLNEGDAAAGHAGTDLPWWLCNKPARVSTAGTFASLCGRGGRT
jgi:hypothetical protein